MKISAVLKSFFIGFLLSLSSLWAGYQFPSFGYTKQKKPHLEAQIYDRCKAGRKLHLRNKPQPIKSSSQIRLATNNRQQLYLQLEQFKQQLIQAEQQHNTTEEQRCGKRIEAVKKTIENNGAVKDYQNLVPQPFITHSNNLNICFVGTDLDQCLHEELCAIQQQALTVLNHDPTNIYAQHMVPCIIDSTIQIKQEQDPLIAFAQADTAEQLTKIIHYTSKTFCAIGRGIEKSLHNIISLEHWKQMAVGLKNVATAVITNASEQELLEDAHCCYDKNISKQLLQLYEHKTKKQKQELYQHFVTTYQQLKKLSNSELLEAGTEFAITILLDTVMLNAASWVATSAGRTTIATIERALYSGCAEQYTAELLGLSRVVITKDEHALIKLFCEFDQDAALVKDVGFLPSDYLRKELNLHGFRAENIEKKINEILNGAKRIKTKRSIIYEKQGNLQDALNEFNSFQFNSIR